MPEWVFEPDYVDEGKEHDQGKHKRHRPNTSRGDEYEFRHPTCEGKLS